MKIIKPSCLSVDMAMIFLKSISKFAAKPLIIIVKREKILRKNKNSFKRKFIRIRRYTPAVTRVEEWTREETGVGAAMAAGNQEQKGY